MSVLGHLETGNPKDVTQQDSTGPQRTFLIWICKDMMSKMDLVRAWEWQDEVGGTFLVTCKFSSSIFCWKGLHKFQEDESKNTKDKPRLLHFGASVKGLSPTIDVKINTLESEGKCSPSHGKSTKRASQFDLKLTRDKTKSNLRAYRLGFRISLRWAYQQALPIL